MTAQRSEYSEIAQIIQSTLEPLMAKLDTKIDRLELKVNHLSEDRVTRADVEKLRSELVTTMVPRDSYEARHTSIISRASDMETRLKKHEEDAQSIVQKLYEKFELSNRDLESQFKEHEKKTEEKLDKKDDVHLNNKERGWLRFSQISGALAIIIAIIGILLEHVRLQ